jgi:hypothetical protein
MSDTPTRSSLPTELLESVDRSRLMAHIGEFAKRVKLSGSPQELESFRYLEAEMGSYGYRTELLSHDAYISLPLASTVSVAGKEIRSITHSMSPSTGPAGIEAPLVHLGEGGPADFAGKDVAGKIVLIDGGALEDVADLASKAGAIGQIHISPTEHLYEMCISPVWGSPSQHNRADLPKAAAATIPNAEGMALRKRCAGGATIPVFLRTEVDTGWRKTPLLVCELEAAGDAGGPFILFSGHHDTWHFGVMDNGGANAAMLEASRLLAQQRAAWRRGLRVCFWSGHSHGRYSGSAWYADEFWTELERRCAAHVNLDSAGAVGAAVLTQSGVVDELRALAREAIAAETGQLHAGRRQGRAADQSFWGVGVPSMFGSLSHQPPGPVKVPAQLGWWWHTPHDLVDKIDEANLARDTRIVLHVLWQLLVGKVLPFDYQTYADALADELERIDRLVAGRFDMNALHRATARLREAAVAAAASAATASPARAEAIDRALMRASRMLVPINYTSGERYHHDPAMPLPAWLALEPLRELAARPPSSEDEPFYVTEARRARNRVLHALDEATAWLSGGRQ